MKTAKTALKPTYSLNVYGKLERVLLDEISLTVDRTRAPTKGRANISVTQEIGIPDSNDGFFVSIIVTVQAIAEDTTSIMYTIKAKATGVYSLPEKIQEKDHEHIVSQAGYRAGLQVYPLIRRVVQETLAGAGFTISLPFDPAYAELENQGSPQKRSESSEKVATTNK
jgi:preprotein translocase subunit SecB